MKDLKNKAIKIKGKDYVQVKDRILALSSGAENYSIETEYQYFEGRKMWVVKAKLTWDGNVYTGLAQEIESDNYKDVNHTSALENAETSAVGRACAMAGIGVLDSIASADEMNKAINRSGAPRREGLPKWVAGDSKDYFYKVSKRKDGTSLLYIRESKLDSNESHFYKTLEEMKAAMLADSAKGNSNFIMPTL